MQRSIPNKKSLADSFVYILLFVVYESLSSIYLFLPPLFGVLFVLLINSLDKNDNINFLFVSFCLLIFEADKGYTIFSSIVYLLFIYKFILPKIVQNFSCYSCVKISYVLLAYAGFYLFNLLLANIFLLPIPEISYYIFYYIIIEFLIVSIL